MTTPAAVHNAVGLLVDLYGGLLKAQADEIALLRQQVDLLTAALKRVSIPTGHDLAELEKSVKLSADDSGGSDGGEDVRKAYVPSTNGK